MQLVHPQCSISMHEPYLRLIERLLPVMPHASLDSFFFWNSGTEAVEASLKMARHFTGRQNVICMQGGYHGRTYGAMAVTKSKTIYSEFTGSTMVSIFSDITIIQNGSNMTSPGRTLSPSHTGINLIYHHLHTRACSSSNHFTNLILY